jgi:hypothetical protein
MNVSITLNGSAVSFCDICSEVTDGAQFCPTHASMDAVDLAWAMDPYLGGNCCAFSAGVAGSATACKQCVASWL